MILFVVIVLATLLWVAFYLFDWDPFSAIFFSFVGFLLVVFVFCTNINTAGQLAAEKVRYESLVFQLENNFYDNDNDIGKAELMAQIQDWNEDLARGKAADNNIWIDVFFPEIFEDLDFIELKGE